MFCLYCGNNLPDDAIFCNRCGKQQKPAGPTPSIAAPSIEMDQAPAGNMPTLQGTPQAEAVPTIQGTLAPLANATAERNASLVPPGSSAPLRTPSSALPPEPPHVGRHIDSHSSHIQYAHDIDHQHAERPEAEQEPSDSDHPDVKAQPTTPAEPKITGHISRRAVIAGLAGVGVVAVAGGLTWLISSRTQNPNSTNVPVHPTPNASSDGTMFGYDLQRTRYNPSEHILNPGNISRLALYWTALIEKGIFNLSSSTIANGLVFIGSTDRKLYAFDAKTGATAWTYTTGSGISCSPAVANGLIYVGSDKLYALDAKTGVKLWDYSIGDGHTFIDLSSPLVFNGVIYVGAKDHKLYALDAKTGVVFWKFAYSDSNTVPIGEGNESSSPAVAGGIIYVCSGSLYALNAKTGMLVWSYTDKTFDFFFSPVVADEIVYTYGGIQVTIPGQDPGSNLYAFDARTGASLWKTHIEGQISTLSPAAADGVIYIGTDDHNLYAFDAKTGTRKWGASLASGNNFNSSPTVANGVVFAGSDDNLYAFDADTGATLWTYTTGDKIYSSPTVADGVVYVSYA